MYVEFLKMLTTHIEALNAASKIMDETDEEMSGYVNYVPILMEEVLCGFLVDEVGGIYSYREATTEEELWWKQRPWAKTSFVK